MRNAMELFEKKRLWDPFEGMGGFQRDFDQLFGNRLEQAGSSRQTQLLAPACDIEETDNHYLMSFDLPGVPKDQIKIEVQGNQLMVSAERKTENSDRKQGVHRTERFYGRYQRVFTLPDRVNTDQIEANYEDGVLRLAVPKSEEAKPRQIRVGDGKSGIFSRWIGKKSETAKSDIETTAEKRSA